MDGKKLEELKQIAAGVRRELLKAIHNAKTGHPGGSLSAVELLTVLYFYKMRVDPKNPKWPERDRFILSKGHGSAAVLALLAMKGFFPLDWLHDFRQLGDRLDGNLGIHTPGGDFTTGSLGQYLSVACGMAMAGRMDKKDYKVYIILGDGELEEGQNWEAFMAAAYYRLGNVVAILDYNKVQQTGTNEEIMSLGDIEAKFRAFGWNVHRIDGHNMEQIAAVLDSLPNNPTGIPNIIIADTIKGKGVSYMEGTCQWHGGAPSDEQLAQALKELGGHA
jgi:transketolase